MTTAFDTLLVANRGEIAVRVLRGAKRLGLRTVAVYSDADRDALHVIEADEAQHIGPSPAAQSYLDIGKLIEAAQRSGAQAIHPGYGFLSEREAFAQAVHDAGLIFVGPDAASIAAMGNKSASKRLMLAAGVPCIPGYQGAEQDDDTLIAESLTIGLPVMVKAAAGGGGRGMRLVHEEDALREAIRSARSEAQNAFGSGELLIEKAVLDARHVEIQVFGDRHGNIVHLGERDCSVQRRNQKVIEEAPSPAVDEALRVRMGEAAVAAARAVNYVGAGTVEFMLARDGQFYFLEMNTRLQVEHPVTELVYGVDLVEWQLRVARGEPLPLTQDQILERRSGWAIEVRLCAEDARQGYLPQTGRVLRWRVAESEGLRCDTWLRDGQTISPYYDSLQAKLMAWGSDREQARQRLLRALRETTLFGVVHNRDHLVELLAHPAFAAGEVSTGFIAQHFAATTDVLPAPLHWVLAAIALYLADAQRLAREHALPQDWLGWHSSHETPAPIRLQWRDARRELRLSCERGRRFHALCEGEAWAVDVERSDEDGFDYRCRQRSGRVRCLRDGDAMWIDDGHAVERYEDRTQAPAQAAAAGSDGRLLAHSDGRVAAVLVQAGERVRKGQTLAVLEAMKMEFQLALPVAGVVRHVAVETGAQVRKRQLLVHVEVEPE